ncbi:MAG: sensor histidine kinase [Aquabacterium sp.]|uniref:sensor histidine kinase n=1 Tax=Aquabacterium sp. TaxID=1872578 RepID=UPI0035C6864B
MSLSSTPPSPEPSRSSPPALPDLAAVPEGMDETAWLDVIHKMDEVYQQLVRDEIALEEKNAQLEQSQQFILSLLSSMSDVLVACDSQGRIEETNAALCELVGRDEASLRGSSALDLLADEDSVQRLREVLGTWRPSRAGAVLEIQLRDAQGHSVPVDLNCTPRRNASARVVGYVFVGRPMGEIKRAYQELQRAHEALKQAQQQLLHSEKMASLGRLVAGVAHELNNPISFVLGNVHALKKYTDRMATYLQAVHAGEPPALLADLRQRLRIDHALSDLPSLIEGTLEGAQRTTDIVNGLKRFSVMDREEREPVDLNAVIERAIHWVRKGTAPGFAIHWVPQPRCLVRASAGQLLQVVMNLIQNAYDAASAIDPQPELWITLTHTDREATITLRDNGPGIPPEHMGRLFDPFFTTKPVGKGTGLGLSISFGTIEQHGGRLVAANAPEGGAVFSVTLPLLNPLAPASS